MVRREQIYFIKIDMGYMLYCKGPRQWLKYYNYNYLWAKSDHVKNCL